MALQTDDLEICAEFKRRLRERVSLVALALFGSRARGEAGPESDYDFFVEVERSDRDVREAVRNTAWEVAFEHGTVFQTIIVGRQELENGLEDASLLVREVRREGIPI